MIKFEQLIKALNQHNAKYIIVGGFAAVIHGASYITNDIDICYERSLSNFKALVAALTKHKPRLRGPGLGDLPFVFDEITLKNGMNFTFQTDLGDIDLLAELAGVGNYQNIKKHAETVTLFSEECFVISLEDLITTKKAAGRRKDLLVLDELEALKALKKM